MPHPKGNGAAGKWERRGPESNRCTRLCRPLPNHSATAPARVIVSAGLAAPIKNEQSAASDFRRDLRGVVRRSQNPRLTERRCDLVPGLTARRTEEPRPPTAAPPYLERV